MSQTPYPDPPLPPTLVDYFFLLLGFALSVFLSRAGPLPVAAKAFVTAAPLRQIIPYLSDMMRLPEGVLLLWPVFLVIQRCADGNRGLLPSNGCGSSPGSASPDLPR